MTDLSFRTIAAQVLPRDPPRSMLALIGAQYYDGASPPRRPASPEPVPENFPSLRSALLRGEPPRYDQIFRLAGHNSYERQYSRSLGEALDRTRTIEIDFYDENDAIASKIPFVGGGGKRRHWYVRHDPAGGNHSCCSGLGGLADCLRDIRDWSDAHPGHEAITVFLDKKQGWSDEDEGRTPADLDALIVDCLPRLKLFTPADLKGPHPTLRAAASSGAWPLITELRDRIVLVMTAGSFLSVGNNGAQAEYIAARGADAAMFMAPDTNEASDILQAPDQFEAREAGWVVFHNLPKDKAGLGAVIRRRGCVSRIWGIEEDDATYRRMVAARINFIALYRTQVSSFNNGRMEGVFPT